MGEEQGAAGSDSFLDSSVLDADAAPDADADATSDGSVPQSTCSVEAPRVLVLHGGAIGRDHPFARRARTVLEEHRVEHDNGDLDDAVVYEIGGVGHYAALLVTDYGAYERLDAKKRRELELYSRRCGAGLFFLHVPAGATLASGEIAASAPTLSDARVEATSPILDLTRDGGVVTRIPGSARVLGHRASDDLQPLAWATSDGASVPWMLADPGERDGLRRVYNLRDYEPFFLADLLLVDALGWLSAVPLGVLRERYVGVDIDDIFMPAHHDDPAQRTAKMQASDVPALIETQQRISESIGCDFRFVLGFNAGFFETQAGDQELYDDAAGDRALVAARDAFYWFDHLWRHTTIIDQPYEEIAGIMQRGRRWAEETLVSEHIGQYAVTPQHGGISQRHTPLYEAWRDVWDVRYASDTSGAGQGFEHLGILVAPRARANIWSSQFSFDHVSRQSLEKYARGGTVYGVIVGRPVAIFMTHQSNYARDRIGNYMFEEVFAFLAQWTTYTIKTGSPEELVRKHFELTPLR